MLPPFSVKDKWNSLPLANIFTDPRVQHLFEQGFVVLKDLGRLDEKLRACAQQIADIICDLCPEICLELNDVMSFCGTFMTSSDENVSGDVVVHTVELDRRGGVVQEGGGGSPSPSSSTSTSSTTTIQVLLVLLLPLFLLTITSSSLNHDVEILLSF